MSGGEFIALIEDLVLFEQVVGNTAVFDGAAGEHLPVLEAIEDDSPFHDLAQTVIGTTEDQIAVGQLLTRAGTEHDPTYWDQVLEISASFDQQAADFATAFDEACGYWRALQ